MPPTLEFRRRASSVLQKAIILVAMFLAPAPSGAQPVTDPTKAEFNASPDHDATVSGAPLLSSYQLELYPVGDSEPVLTLDLGKPDVDPDGVIRVDLVSLLVPLQSGTNYVARVAAVGPGGITRSDPSNPFTWSVPPPWSPPPEPPAPPPSEPPPPEPVVPPPCTYSISPLAQSAGAEAYTFTVSVATAGQCFWTATESLSWVSITSAASGSGDGSVTYSVEANTGALRSGSLTIAGETLSITQTGGAACTYSLSPSVQSLSASAETAIVTVSTGSSCSWTVTHDSSWITITSGASGTGTRTVTYAVTANPGASRSGTLTIAGIILEVTQEAGAPGVPPAPGNFRIVPP